MIVKAFETYLKVSPVQLFNKGIQMPLVPAFQDDQDDQADGQDDQVEKGSAANASQPT